MGEYVIAGILGQKMELSYSSRDDRCSVRIPGYDITIAELPMNTVDAILTREGSLIYMDHRRDVKALRVPNHEPIYRAACAGKATARNEGRGFTSIMGRHTSPATLARQEALENLKLRQDQHGRRGPEDHGAGRAQDREMAPTADDFSLMFHDFAKDLIREYIAPLVQDISRLNRMNVELASKLKHLERRSETVSRRSRMPSRTNHGYRHPMRRPGRADRRSERCGQPVLGAPLTHEVNPKPIPCPDSKIPGCRKTTGYSPRKLTSRKQGLHPPALTRVAPISPVRNRAASRSSDE